MRVNSRSYVKKKNGKKPKKKKSVVVDGCQLAGTLVHLLVEVCTTQLDHPLELAGCQNAYERAAVSISCLDFPYPFITGSMRQQIINKKLPYAYRL